ncbi:Cu(I)-responsive transcriptional regulator [soil metagenome]
MSTYTIGDAARAAGVTPRAIRLWESRGLMPESDRTDSGYRVFTDADVEVLEFIRRGRGLGLSLDAIAEIMDIAASGEPCCDRTQSLLAQRVAEIDAAIADLRRLRETVVVAQRAEVDQRAGARCAVIEAAG